MSARQTLVRNPESPPQEEETRGSHRGCRSGGQGCTSVETTRRSIKCQTHEEQLLVEKNLDGDPEPPGKVEIRGAPRARRPNAP